MINIWSTEETRSTYINIELIKIYTEKYNYDDSQPILENDGYAYKLKLGKKRYVFGLSSIFY